MRWLEIQSLKCSFNQSNGYIHVETLNVHIQKFIQKGKTRMFLTIELINDQIHTFKAQYCLCMYATQITKFRGGVNPKQLDSLVVTAYKQNGAKRLVTQSLKNGTFDSSITLQNRSHTVGTVCPIVKTEHLTAPSPNLQNRSHTVGTVGLAFVGV